MENIKNESENLENQESSLIEGQANEVKENFNALTAKVELLKENPEMFLNFKYKLADFCTKHYGDDYSEERERPNRDFVWEGDKVVQKPAPEIGTENMKMGAAVLGGALLVYLCGIALEDHSEVTNSNIDFSTKITALVPLFFALREFAEGVSKKIIGKWGL